MITKEEAAQLRRRPDGRASYARGLLLAMHVGELMLLESNDWMRKSQSPKTYCLMLGRKTGMGWKCERVMGGLSVRWLIERTK